MELPTVTLKDKDGGTAVVNETDYRYPDGTVQERWKGWTLHQHNPLNEIQLQNNQAEQERREAKEKAAAASRAAADAELTDGLQEALADVLASREALEVYIEGLPSKAAVEAFASSQGATVDVALTRPNLNAATVDALAPAEEEEE